MQNRQLGCGVTLVLITLAGLIAAGLFLNSSPPVGAQSSVNPQAEFERVNPAFLAAVLPCQVGVTAAQKALEASDLYRAYDVVQGAKQACFTAWQNVNTISYGGAMPQPYRDSLNADLQRCASAYSQDRAAMDEVGSVIDGDGRPSTVVQTGYDVRRAAAEVSACLTSYKDDLRAAGVKLPEAAKVQAPAHTHHHRHAPVSTDG